MRPLRCLLLTLCLVAGCYSVPRSEVAARYRTIYVPTLENATFEPGLHTRVTQAIRREIQNGGHLRLVNSREEADVVLTGTLTSYGVRASSFDEDDNPLQFAIGIGGDVTIRDARTDAIVWKRRNLTANDFYQVRTVAAGRGRDEGLNEAAEEFAERVVFEFIDGAW